MSPEYLSVRGSIIDQVAFVATQAIKSKDIGGKAANEYATILMPLFHDNMLPLLDETQDLVRRYVPDPYPGGVQRQEAYWRAMIMDRFFDQTPAAPEAEGFLFYVCNMYRQFETNSGSINLSEFLLEKGRTDEQKNAGINSLMTRITRVWMPHTFVILASGYMGWSPHGVKVGDVFCMFDGCDVPFVLRPTAGADTFTFLGTGYVQGIMAGQQPGVGGKPREWIKII